MCQALHKALQGYEGSRDPFETFQFTVSSKIYIHRVRLQNRHELHSWIEFSKKETGFISGKEGTTRHAI